MDTGVGIPVSQQQVIFQEFKRLNPDSKRQDSGLGLGLAIVDKIARVLAHPVHVRSEEGRGSVFSVEVPLGERVPRLEGTETSQPLQLSRLQGTRIWLIDNDPAICDAMQTLLGGWGCEVVTALSLEMLAAEVDLATETVDLLIVDFHLDGELTGLEAASDIREKLQQPLPVLMITADYSRALKQQVRDSGYLLINKPVKPMKLKTTISHLLDNTPLTGP